MSVISGLVSGILGAKAQRKATEAQERQADEYNALLREMYHQTRGSEGSAFLPEYLKGVEGSTARRAGDISGALSDFYGTPEDIVRRGEAVAGTYKPLLDAGTKSIYGIFSGDLERRRLEAAEPVFSARTVLGDVARQGIMGGLGATLVRLKALAAGKGYVGGSSGEVNAATRASIDANQGAAAATAQANLLNETDKRAIRDEILNLELRSPELAGSLAAQAIRFETLPAEVAGAIARGELSPLDWFKIGVGQPPQQTMAPWAQPEANLGMILAGAGAQAGNTAARYFLNRDLAERYRAAPRTQLPPNYNAGAGYTPYDQYPDYIDYGAWYSNFGGAEAAASAANAAAAGAF